MNDTNERVVVMHCDDQNDPTEDDNWLCKFYPIEEREIRVNMEGYEWFMAKRICSDAGYHYIAEVTQERLAEYAQALAKEGWAFSLMFERAKKAIEGEIETYLHWLNGEVYGVVVQEFDEENDEWVDTDIAVWGFYGDDWMNNGMADCVPEHLHEQLENPETQYG